MAGLDSAPDPEMVAAQTLGGAQYVAAPTTPAPPLAISRIGVHATTTARAAASLGAELARIVVGCSTVQFPRSVAFAVTLLDMSRRAMIRMFQSAADRWARPLEQSPHRRVRRESAGAAVVLAAAVFNYVVNNWLMGNDPPAFDIMAWNNDVTRQPRGCTSSSWRSSSTTACSGPGR